MLLNFTVRSNPISHGLSLTILLVLSGCGVDPQPTADKTNPKEIPSTTFKEPATKEPASVSKVSKAEPEPDKPSEVAKDAPDVGKKNEVDTPVRSDPPVAEPKPKVADVNDERFHSQLLEAIDEYLQYAMVNTAPMIAPTDCRPPDQEPRPKVSEADEGTAHGKKLYFLFAKDLANYTGIEKKDSPLGQVLVKESWSSKPSHENARNMRTHASAVRVNPRVFVDGKILAIGKRTDLFVMLKLDPKTEGTDEGWVYGVVDADSRNVKTAGKVASCMECHVEQNDRLFRVEQAIVIREEVVPSKVDDAKETPNKEPNPLAKEESDPKEAIQDSKSSEDAKADSKEKSGDGDQ